MRLKIRQQAVKVRADNRQSSSEKFTGSTTYSVVGTLDDARVRLALGTDIQRTAIRRVEKIATACADGPESLLWPELEDCLPAKTFEFFSAKVGYVHRESTSDPTWKDLCDLFEAEMKRRIANKIRGASRKEGVMSESTRDRYRLTIKNFGAHIGEAALLSSIKPTTIELYKVSRLRKIEGLKQSRGGSSIALEVAILHVVFAFAAKKKLMTQPIDLSVESKPGENPKNGARAFTADELTKLREHAKDDLFAFLLLRWTGLRCSDAIKLQWRHIHFDRGRNGEIEIVTEKRSKLALIPLSPELRDALEETLAQRSKIAKVLPDDIVLYNPQFNQPYSTRHRLYERMKALGVRAGVERVTPHCFRDTFACDMLARGTDIYAVSQMLADVVDTIQKHYAQFVPAARDSAQEKMEKGFGIEEQAQRAKDRDKKVAVFPGRLR